MKFRRNKADQTDVPDSTEAEDAPGASEGTGATQGATQGATRGATQGATRDAAPPSDNLRATGPWDAGEVSIDEEDETKVDLGGLIVTGKPGLELRLQVDEASQQVAAVLLLGPEGALELRPFAAPRNTDIWDDIRRQIAAETSRRGGTATEDDGSYGKELRVAMPVTTPDGQPASQPSRVLGISGPRWLLRATFLGKPAMEPDPDGDIESALRDVIVVRGSDPMSPGEPLPLVMPANAQPAPQSAPQSTPQSMPPSEQ